MQAMQGETRQPLTAMNGYTISRVYVLALECRNLG